jgi:hypothetical protein
VSSLLTLMYLVFSILSVQLFSKIKYGENINDHTNFRTVGAAMLVWIRCSTGEGWNLIMHEAANRDNCVVDPVFDPQICGFSSFSGSGVSPCVPLTGCGGQAAYPIFLLFSSLVTFVFVNLFIAVSSCCCPPPTCSFTSPLVLACVSRLGGL